MNGVRGKINKKMQSSNILVKITDIYIFVLTVLFPLMVDKTGFFKILEYKYTCFVSISTFYISAITLIYIYLVIKNRKKFLEKKLSIVQKLAIIFLSLNIVSCFISPFLKDYNLFVGVGRREGLITSCLYILTFLYISYFGKFKKKYILYFSVSSILINLIAILQFIGLNPFNMYQDGIGTHNVSFMTTIGNVDFISALYTILLSVSFGAFVFLNNNWYENLIHLLSILMGSFILEIIDVSSGKFAFAIVLILLIPFIFKNNVRLARFLKIMVMILSGIVINIILNVEYHYDLGKLGFYFQFNYIVLLFFIVIIILYLLSKYVNNLEYKLNDSKTFIKNYYKLLVVSCLLGLIIIFLVPFKSGFLYEIHELLHFNFDDNFGTYRIFLWKRTIPLIKNYTLFGSGPDTFALRFMPLYTDDITKIGPLTINDTAANIYLTMLVNLGVVGTTSYVLFLISQLIIGIKRMNNNSRVLLIAIMCYAIQSFFNLSVVIVSPIFWILMGVHHLSIEVEKGVKNYEGKEK